MMTMESKETDTEDDSKLEEMLSEETKNLMRDSEKSPVSIINEYIQKNQLPKMEFVDVNESGNQMMG